MTKYEVIPEACRICLKKHRSCRSIFKPIDDEEIAPSEKLRLVSGVTTIQNDKDFPSLPQSICKPCEISLNMAFNFRITARKSDQIIHFYCNRVNKDDNIIVELDNGRKFKLSKELTLKRVRKNKTPTTVLTIEEEMHSNSQQKEEEEEEGNEFDGDRDLKEQLEELEDESGLEEHLERIDSLRSLNYENEEELLTEEEESIEDQENEEAPTDVKSKDNFYLTNNYSDDNQDHYLDVKPYDEADIDIKEFKEHEYKQEEKPTAVYNAEEIAKRLEASDKYEVISWKQENGENSVPVFKLRLKGVVTKQLTSDFICEICGNTYQQRHRLTEHMRRHTKEKRYECEICSKRFSVAEGLRRHILTHGAKKPYKCSICTRRFFNPSARKAHEKVHSGAKPYVCKICDRAFAYTCSLHKHMLIHQNKKLYRCDYCFKEFRLQHHLKQHEETQIHKDAVAEHHNLQQS